MSLVLLALLLFLLWLGGGVFAPRCNRVVGAGHGEVDPLEHQGVPDAPELLATQHVK